MDTFLRTSPVQLDVKNQLDRHVVKSRAQLDRQVVKNQPSWIDTLLRAGSVG